MVAEWCTIFCPEDNTTCTVHARKLETDSSDFVTESDLQEGAELVWRCKGKPYTVEVKDIHGNLHEQFSSCSFL